MILIGGHILEDIKMDINIKTWFKRRTFKYKHGVTLCIYTKRVIFRCNSFKYIWICQNRING